MIDRQQFQKYEGFTSFRIINIRIKKKTQKTPKTYPNVPNEEKAMIILVSNFLIDTSCSVSMCIVANSQLVWSGRSCWGNMKERC